MCSELVNDILNDAVEVFVCVFAICVETERDVFERLEEAVEVHLGILAPFNHVFVDDVVVRLRDIIISHVVELRELLKLTRRYKVVVLLPCEVLENRFSVRVQIQLVVTSIRSGQDQF